MIQLKPFGLKLLYFLTGFPLLFLFIIWGKETFEQYPDNLIWFGLLAILVVTRILIQKEKYETGFVKPSLKTVILAFTFALILGQFLYNFI